MHNKKIHTVTFILLVIGGLNWLLEAFGFGIASWGFIPSSVLTIIYILVGLSAIYEVATHKNNCKVCTTGGVSTPTATMPL